MLKASHDRSKAIHDGLKVIHDNRGSTRLGALRCFPAETGTAGQASSRPTVTSFKGRARRR